MKVTAAALGVIAIVTIAPIPSSAKGDTVRITISGGNLSAPIQITDPAVVSRYQVWSGPGTSSYETQSLNIDWSRRLTEPPKGLQIYEVSFVTTRQNPG